MGGNKEISLIINIPVNELKSFYKFGYNYYMNNKKPTEYAVEFKTVNGRRVHRLTNTSFNLSNNAWTPFSANSQYCGTLVNVNSISYATITIKFNLDADESFYFSNPRFTSF